MDDYSPKILLLAFVVFLLVVVVANKYHNKNCKNCKRESSYKSDTISNDSVKKLYEIQSH